MQELDLRQEVLARLNEPETRQRIADALITEATGGPPDPKSGVPKGGATVIRAFELIREIALERAPSPAAEPDFSRYTDAELVATLTRLEAEESLRLEDGASGTPNDGTPSERERSPPERERAPPGSVSGAETESRPSEAVSGAETESRPSETVRGGVASGGRHE